MELPVICFLPVFIILAVVAGIGFSRTILVRMAWRNFSRRKAHSAIVIAGLMIGTAIISSSLVVGDTMEFIFEVDTLRSLGEVDQQVWGTSPLGGTEYFSEEIYYRMMDRLDDVAGIESIAPVLSETWSVRNVDSGVNAPSVAVLGLNSSILRTTVFGNLDGLEEGGFYPDSLAHGEIAINSRLANSIDAEVGHTIVVSYGSHNPLNPFSPIQSNEAFTITTIIQERSLYGKANYRMRSSMFLELETAQDMMNRQGMINLLWISNEGDALEGEKQTDSVIGPIRNALNDSIGISDVGYELRTSNDSITLVSTPFVSMGLFKQDFAKPMLDIAEENGANTTSGAVALTLSLGGTEFPSAIMGIDPMPQNLESGALYMPTSYADMLGITNGSLEVMTLGREMSPLNNTVDVVLVPDHFLASLPTGHTQGLPIVGFTHLDTVQNMVTRNPEEDDAFVSFVTIHGLSNETITAMASPIATALDDNTSYADANLEVHTVKKTELERGRAAGESIGMIFTIFSTFAVVAGMALIVNIFVMLGEERKSEMGMARAVGMKRSDLVKVFMLEGSIYTFVSSAVGALLGLVLGRGMIYAFSAVFMEFNEGESFPFHFTWGSVMTAFLVGTVLTFATIVIASRRISRINIIRAIRKIPEPRPPRAERKELIIGLLMLVGGVAVTMWAASSLRGEGWLAGPPLIFLGIAMISHRFFSLKATITFASLAILFWLLNPFDLPLVKDSDFSGIGVFVISGLVLVLASVLLIMFNTNIIICFLQRLLGNRRTMRAVLKTAISYPSENKFKTGMTIGMFSLIVFTVTVVAMITGMQASAVDSMMRQQSGGYDIIGYTNPTTPFQNFSSDELPPSLQDIDVLSAETLAMSAVRILDYDRKEGTQSDYAGGFVPRGKTESYTIVGVSPSFSSSTGFTLRERDGSYSTDQDAWMAIQNDPDVCIIDGSGLEDAAMMAGMEPAGAYLGGTIIIEDFAGEGRTRELRVIGITDQMFFVQGIIMSKDIAVREYNAMDRMILVELGDSVDTKAANRAFEDEYAELGLQTIDVQELIDTIVQVSSNIMYLMQAFLGLGLIVGIAGIGIISYRNVVERRQQIGMLRAIGFKRNMITISFLMETSYITLMATITGILLGIAVGWQIYIDDSAFREMGASFTIPWLNLTVILTLAYFATMLFTFSPSRKASKIPPAEALRYIE